MKAKNVNNLPTPGDIAENDGILITKGTRVMRMLMAKFREYIGYASGAELLGVPVPTSKDARKAMTVNEDGTGYELQYVKTADLLWKNEDTSADFPAQSIACDNVTYSFIIVFFIREAGVENTTRAAAVIAKDGNNHDMQLYECAESGILAYYREMSADDTGFVFTDGKRNLFDGASTHQVTKSGKYAVPAEIYGIR